MTRMNHVAYARMGICNPVNPDAIEAMLDRTDLKAGDRAAELGCGNGALAAFLAGRGLAVEAFERDPVLAEMARGRSGAITVREGEADALAAEGAPWRLLAALGSTGLGDLGRLAAWLEPGGWLLWGDLFWKGEPDPALNAAMGNPDYATDAGWRARGEAAGLELVEARISPDEEWDAYTGALDSAVHAWAAENLDHPDRAAVVQRAELLLTYWRSAGRSALGFSLYLFRKPA